MNKYKVIEILGSEEFESFLLSHNIGVGTIFTKGYAPALFNLTIINFDNKSISLRNEDFNKIKWEIVM